MPGEQGRHRDDAERRETHRNSARAGAEARDAVDDAVAGQAEGAALTDCRAPSRDRSGSAFAVGLTLDSGRRPLRSPDDMGRCDSGWGHAGGRRRGNGGGQLSIGDRLRWRCRRGCGRVPDVVDDPRGKRRESEALPA